MDRRCVGGEQDPSTQLRGALDSRVGRGGREDPEFSAERYNPPGDTWKPAPKPRHSRDGATMTLLQDGTVLLAGDYDYPPERTTELYTPAT